jgi:hypothetical protein
VFNNKVEAHVQIGQRIFFVKIDNLGAFAKQEASVAIEFGCCSCANRCLGRTHLGISAQPGGKIAPSMTISLGRRLVTK